jgi:hypothetical protein
VSLLFLLLISITRFVCLYDAKQTFISFFGVYSKHVGERELMIMFSLYLSQHLKIGPYTEYRIIVIAFTLKYDGEPSDPTIQRTDISGPSAPQIINLTCHSQDSLYLHWKRPTSFYNSIDFYMINYRENGYTSYQQIQLNTNASLADAWVCWEHSFLAFMYVHSLTQPFDLQIRARMH